MRSKRRNAFRRHMMLTAHMPRKCLYCGEPADQRDHVIPYSAVGNNTPVVWACGECNRLASNHVFYSIEEKRSYIHKKLRIRYKWVFDAPDWDEHEMESLGNNMKGYVLAGQTIQDNIYRRLAWKTSIIALIAERIIEQAAGGRDTALMLAELNDIEKKEMRLLMSTETDTGMVSDS